MALDVKQYIEQLAQTAGFSDEEKASVLKAVANEKFAKSLGDDVLRQQDYSRNMDALKTKEKATTDKYHELVTWKAGEEQKINDFWTTYQANGGQPVVNSDYLTKKELAEFQAKQQEELNKRDQNYIGLLKVGMRLASQHVNEFHESLDTEALTKIAVDKNISIEQAYNEMVGPRRTEFQSAARTAELAKAREEGAREFASKHKIPVDTGAREPEFGRLAFNRDPKQTGIEDYQPNTGRLSPASESKLRNSFMEEWDKAGSANTSGT